MNRTALHRTFWAGLALVLIGCREPAQVQPPAAPAGEGVVWFEDVAAARGIDFRHESGHGKRPLLPEIMGGGAALFDMDGDGDLDAYLVQSGRMGDAPESGPGNRVYRNDGSGNFADATGGSGADDRGYGMGVAAGDYDNDGRTDLYVTNLGPNVLLHNEGGGRFSDRTLEAGVGHPGWGTSAAFFDYDRDGDLDLFATNYIHWSETNERDCINPRGQPDYCSPKSYKSPAIDVLYRNDGDGTFSDVTAELGIETGFGNGLGVVAADFDGDGWIDVFVANDGMLDQLWRNDAGHGFEDIALIAGTASDQEGLAKAGMGVSTGDVDADGDLDLLVCNLFAESDSFFRNDGRYFTDVTAQKGLGVSSRLFTRFGLGWVDFDNDGAFDLYQANGRVTYQSKDYTDDPYAEPNLAFRGDASGRFEELSPRGATARALIHTSRAAAFGDVDGDGGIDVLVGNRDAPPYLLRNVAADRGNWALFRALENGGRDAEGAIVTFSVGDRKLRRDVRSGYSYLAANSPRVHVGLATATRIDGVRVRWVDGVEESFGPFEANASYTLRRGDGGG